MRQPRCLLVLSLLAGAVAGQTADLRSARPIPPPPPPPAVAAAGSPVAEFRRLLALPPSQREAEVASWPAERRPLAEALRSKLDEYAALPAEDRETRLRALDLRWHLTHLMRLPPEQRGSRLDLVTDDMRPLVEERLRYWDGLPEAARAELVENEATARQFLSLAATPVTERPTAMSRMSASQRQRLQESLAHWRALPPEQRQRLTENFERFFDLPGKERRKTLNTLSELERRQMEATLRQYEQLSPARRAACLDGFSRFASMSPAEREAFLRHAERWQAMTPAERQTWRSLVLRMPPLPPGFKRVPPIPPAPPVPPRSPAVTLTNRVP